MGVASGWPSSELMLVVVACFATLLPYDGVGMARIVHSTQSLQCEPWSSSSVSRPELAKRAFPWDGGGSAGVRDSQCVRVCEHTHTHSTTSLSYHACHYEPCKPCNAFTLHARRDSS